MRTEFDRSYRSEIRHSSSGGSDLQIVSAKIDNLNRPYTVRSLPPPPDHFQYYRKYELEEMKKKKKSGKSGGCFSDPEMKRKKRVAAYKAYSVEGKVKGKIKKGWKWIREKCHEIVHGY